LDGVRGIAVLLVMAFHFCSRLSLENPFQHAARGVFDIGWTGVDLFFVLSGFLITGILTDSRGNENYFKSFYIRRALRIFPLYFLSLALYWLIVPALWHALRYGIPIFPEFSAFKWNLPFQLQYVFYLQNIPGITPNHPGPNPLIHYWSVAVEEQYYLVWPLIVFFCSPKRLVRVACALCISVIMLRIGLFRSGVNPAIIYSNTLTRLDGLLIGGIAAIGVRDKVWSSRMKKHVWWFQWLPVVLFPLLRLMGPLKTTAPFMVTVGYTLNSLAYTGVILSVVLTTGSKSRLQMITSNRLLVVAGKYSYAAYLLHPIVEKMVADLEGCFQLVLPGPVHMLIAIGMTLLVSAASYELVEKHFLRLKQKTEPRSRAMVGVLELAH
jgi:peptidoglycan/LPS O-acetylase OafA/YrhL